MAQWNRPKVRWVFLAALTLAAIFALSLAGLRPPAPLPFDAPATRFSAIRAANTLRGILGNDVPHPVGSLANAAVRDRIVGELTRLGYIPQVQTAFSCGGYGRLGVEPTRCAIVNNVLARLDGTAPGDAVLLAAHYDSVPAGPGDSDDGAGVAAVLEIARALKSLPTPRHSIIFLLDDGEEAGLLGAQAFVDSHAWAREVRAVVNLDARGTAGPSLMFQTGSGNEWAAALYSKYARRPAASSIFYAVYERLPNDTDFSVFREAGYQGLNFAYIGREPQYHTPLDNSSHINLASLQHHGENALPMTLALANSDLAGVPRQNGVYFDIFGRRMIYWPVSKTLAFALAGAVLLLLQIGWLLYTKRLTPHQFLWGMVEWLLTLAVIGLLALLVRQIIRATGGAPVNWIAHPIPLQSAYWSLAVAVAMTHGVVFARRAGYWGLWGGVWTWWAVLSIVIAAQIPGFSYVAILPLAVAVLFALPVTLSRAPGGARFAIAAIMPLAAAGIVGFTPALLLYSGLGVRGMIPTALLLGLLFTPAGPLCVELREVPGLRALAFLWVPMVVTVLAVFTTAVMPAYSANSPERVNIIYWRDADSGKSQWIVQPESGGLPEAMRPAAVFRRSNRGIFPWELRGSFVADAPALNVAAPTLTILESSQVDGMRKYRALLRSERGAPSTAVLFPPDAGVQSVRLETQPLGPETPNVRSVFNGWQTYACVTMPASGVEINFSLPVGKPVEVSVLDRSYDLPPEGMFLLNARPFTATPSQDGDVTVVSRRVEFLP